MFSGEPHEVLGLKGGSFFMLHIVGFLVFSLGPFELCLHLVMNLPVLQREGFSRWIWVRSRARGRHSEGAAWVKTVIGKERGHSGGCLLGIVVHKLGQR